MRPLLCKPFLPAQRRRIHEDVAEQLRDAILDGRYGSGERLPPERELAQQFAANRTSIREAIKVLEGLGLVKVRQGDGATVQAPIDGSLDLIGPMIFRGGRIDAEMLGDLAEVMMPLLCEMASLAVERYSNEQLDEVRRLRDLVADVAVDLEQRGGAARDVLVVLSDMTSNRIWQMLARRTRALLESPPLVETRHRLRRDPARLVPLMDAVLNALDADRPQKALEAMRRLIAVVGDPQLSEGSDSNPTHTSHEPHRSHKTNRKGASR